MHVNVLSSRDRVVHRMSSIIFCLLFLSSVEGLRNLSRDKHAQQSTTDDSAGAWKAVDGITALNEASCSTTLLETLVWWQVDLGRHYMIYRIRITTTMDSTQLSDLNVEMTSAYNDGIPFWKAHNLTSFNGVLDLKRPEGVKGRYVYLDIDLTRKAALTVLTLCEVEVFGAVEEYFEMDSKRGATSELLRHQSRSSMECAIGCLSRDICRSFTWDASDNVCRLYGDLPTHTSSADNLIGFISV